MSFPKVTFSQIFQKLFDLIWMQVFINCETEGILPPPIHCKNSGVKFNTPGVVRGPHQVGVNFNLTLVGVIVTPISVKLHTKWLN